MKQFSLVAREVAADPVRRFIVLVTTSCRLVPPHQPRQPG